MFLLDKKGFNDDADSISSNNSAGDHSSIRHDSKGRSDAPSRAYVRNCRWEMMLSLLMQEEHRWGSMNIPLSHKIIGDDGSEIRLGLWLGTQRQAHRKGKLSEDKRLRLQSLVDAGRLEWGEAKATADDKQWDYMFTLLLQYGAAHGHCNVPERYCHPVEKEVKNTPAENARFQKMPAASSAAATAAAGVPDPFLLCNVNNANISNNNNNNRAPGGGGGGWIMSADNNEESFRKGRRGTAKLGRWLHRQRTMLRRKGVRPDRLAKLQKLCDAGLLIDLYAALDKKRHSSRSELSMPSSKRVRTQSSDHTDDDRNSIENNNNNDSNYFCYHNNNSKNMVPTANPQCSTWYALPPAPLPSQPIEQQQQQQQRQLVATAGVEESWETLDGEDSFSYLDDDFDMLVARALSDEDQQAAPLLPTTTTTTTAPANVVIVANGDTHCNAEGVLQRYDAPISSGHPSAATAAALQYPPPEQRRQQRLQLEGALVYPYITSNNSSFSSSPSSSYPCATYPSYLPYPSTCISKTNTTTHSSYPLQAFKIEH